jgi:hypothetical protein
MFGTATGWISTGDRERQTMTDITAVNLLAEKVA